LDYEVKNKKRFLFNKFMLFYMLGFCFIHFNIGEKFQKFDFGDEDFEEFVKRIENRFNESNFVTNQQRSI